MIKDFIKQIQHFFSGRPTLKQFLPGITWFFVLLFLLCIPARDLPKSGDWFERIFFDKWVHLGLFGLLAFLFIAPIYGSSLTPVNKWLYVLLITMLVSAWGLATELIQHYLINGRSFDKYDWLADSIGAFLAIFISKYILEPKRPSKNIF